MIDNIYSVKKDKIYAVIDFKKHEKIPYFYEGIILVNGFPTELYNLIMEYDDMVNSVSLSLIDEVEDKIYSYGLKLQNLDQYIFNLVIKNNTDICFFLKYPTAQGFRDSF